MFSAFKMISGGAGNKFPDCPTNSSGISRVTFENRLPKEGVNISEYLNNLFRTIEEGDILEFTCIKYPTNLSTGTNFAVSLSGSYGFVYLKSPSTGNDIPILSSRWPNSGTMRMVYPPLNGDRGLAQIGTNSIGINDTSPLFYYQVGDLITFPAKSDTLGGVSANTTYQVIGSSPPGIQYPSIQISTLGGAPVTFTSTKGTAPEWVALTK